MLTSFSEIDIPVATSTAVSTVSAALEAAEKIGYPVILRSAFTLGGLGSGFANNPEELSNLSAKSLSLSPQVLIERSMKGWKELEYEVVRDAADVSTASASGLKSTKYSCDRTQSSVATWRTLTRLVLTPVILSLLPRLRPCPTMSTTCSEALPSRLLGILVLLVNVTFNTRSTHTLGNIVSLKSTLGQFLPCLDPRMSH